MTNLMSANRHTTRGWLQKHWFWLAVNIAAALPLIILFWQWGTGNLSVNPIADLTVRTGKTALILMMLSLACTPANILFGFRKALTVRKSLGLWAFAYAAVPLWIFFGVDYRFDWGFILDDTLLTKRYIFVGLAAFLVLSPLAITSTRGWMRRLGRNWTRLHKLAYVGGALMVLHFLWLAKGGRIEPFIYAAILPLLMVVRIPPVRRRVVQFRRRIRSPRNADRSTEKAQRSASGAANPLSNAERLEVSQITTSAGSE